MAGGDARRAEEPAGVQLPELSAAVVAHPAPRVAQAPPPPPAGASAALAEPAAIDPLVAAETARLHCVSDHTPGITRERIGDGKDGFLYRDPQGLLIRDAATLARIRALAVPPAWTAVWICPDADGHIQATGRDARGRKQYRYHPRWRHVRDETKFEHMLSFGRALPRRRRRVETDLNRDGLPREKVLAAVVRLMERSLARVGNPEYAKQNETFGLTTLRNDHVRVAAGGRIELDFRGKHGIRHHKVVTDPKLARILANCRDLPGSELFKYIGPDVRGTASPRSTSTPISTRPPAAPSPPRISAPGPRPTSPCSNAPSCTRPSRPSGPRRRWWSASPSGSATRGGLPQLLHPLARAVLISRRLAQAGARRHRAERPRARAVGGRGLRHAPARAMGGGGRPRRRRRRGRVRVSSESRAGRMSAIHMPTGANGEQGRGFRIYTRCADRNWSAPGYAERGWRSICGRETGTGSGRR